MGKIVMDGLDELNKEDEKKSKAKCSTQKEKPISNEKLNQKPTDLSPVSKIDSMEFSKEKEEAKSKKVLLLMKPSLYAKVKELAEKKGTSVNNAINVMLESLLEAQKG